MEAKPRNGDADLDKRGIDEMKEIVEDLGGALGLRGKKLRVPNGRDGLLRVVVELRDRACDQIIKRRISEADIKLCISLPEERIRTRMRGNG